MSEHPMQFRFCCHEWHWCDKDCENCEQVNKEEYQKQKEQLERDRKLYKAWMVNNGMADKIE